MPRWLRLKAHAPFLLRLLAAETAGSWGFAWPEEGAAAATEIVERMMDGAG